MCFPVSGLDPTLTEGVHVGDGLVNEGVGRHAGEETSAVLGINGNSAPLIHEGVLEGITDAFEEIPVLIPASAHLLEGVTIAPAVVGILDSLLDLINSVGASRRYGVHSVALDGRSARDGVHASRAEAVSGAVGHAVGAIGGYNLTIRAELGSYVCSGHACSSHLCSGRACRGRVLDHVLVGLFGPDTEGLSSRDESDKGESLHCSW